MSQSVVVNPTGPRCCQLRTARVRCSGRSHGGVKRRPNGGDERIFIWLPSGGACRKVAVTASVKKKRERWSSRVGVILTLAGSAVGLGNFLRFRGLAAQYGNGAFMIAYFISLLI